MARVLVVDDDRSILTIARVALEEAGHQVSSLEDAALAADAALRDRPDLIVLDVRMPGLTGFDVLEQIKAERATSSIPILFMSAVAGPEDRVRGLRGGGGDFLVKPFVPAELVMRAERLLGPADAGSLNGDLAAYSIWDLLQQLEHGRHTGKLAVRSRVESAEVRFISGRVGDAHLEPWAGRDALLALLGLTTGRFSFSPEKREAPDVGHVPVQEVLLEATWLQDEIARRKDVLPQAFVPLARTSSPVPKLGEEYARLPLGQVIDHASRPGETSLEALERARLAPWLRTELAVALLVETGALDCRTGETRLPTGAFRVEAGVSRFWDDEEVAIQDVLRLAQLQRRSVGSVHVLLLVEGGAWQSLLDLWKELPDEPRAVPWKQLADNLAWRRGGTCFLRRGDAGVSLHVQSLTEANTPQVLAAVSPCAGVAVWLGDGSDQAVRAVVGRIESSARSQAGVILGEGEQAGRAMQLVKGARRWRTLADAPRSLPGLVRLFSAPAR